MVVGGLCFFFQAEDGIRDLVRSRGLGDVYKRQVRGRRVARSLGPPPPRAPGGNHRPAEPPLNGVRAVSYTHLTLPTSDLV